MNSGEIQDLALLEIAHRLLYRPIVARPEQSSPGAWLDSLRAEGAESSDLPSAALLAGLQQICRVEGISAVWIGESRYPAALRELAHPPPVIFYSGSLPPRRPRALALVGSRHPSRAGREMASRLGEAAAAAGIPVVSGLARGIDQAAHAASLGGAGAGTWAVLGCGLDRIYPPEAGKLAGEIRDRGGLLSEFPPGVPPLPFHFPRRNRIIAALSQCVVVVEAGERSGALSTAREALALGRDLGAVPGSPLNPAAVGSNRLLRAGAHVVLAPDDLPCLQGGKALDAEAAREPWTPKRCQLEDVGDLATLAARAGWLLTEAIEALAEWERRGEVERLSEGRFRVRVVASPRRPG